MKLLIAAVGKIKFEPLNLLAIDYIKRIGKYYPTSVVELKKLEDVGCLLKPADLLIGCDEKGSLMTSAEFATWMGKNMARFKRLVFLIGGADGIGEFKKKAGALLSLSKLTFQHDMARIILLEQIYRAATIIKGEKYHRE